MIGYKTRRSRRAIVLCCAALLFCSLPCSGGQAKGTISHRNASDGNAALELQNGKPVLVRLGANGDRAFRFKLCAGCFSEVRIEQLGWMVSAEVSGPGIAKTIPRDMDAGLHSIIRIPLIGVGDGKYHLKVHVRSMKQPSMVRVTLEPARPATANDKDRVKASELLAEAEVQRHVPEISAAQRALVLYDRALALTRRCHDMRLEQRVVLGRARLYLFRTGEYVAGLNGFLQALSLLHQQKASVTAPSEIALRAFTWKEIASAYGLLAEYPKMVQATNHSLKLYRQSGDEYWEEILEGNVANVYMEMGDTQHALASAENALSIAQRISDVWGIAFTEAALGAIREQRGEYQAAFDANNAALRVMKEINDHDEEGQVWMDDAEIYDELDDPEQEREALMRALPLLHQTGDAVNESEALDDLALLNLQEDRLQDATAASNRAMEIARAHDLRREEAMAYLGQAEVLAAHGNAVQAADAVHAGLALAASTNEAATRAMLMQEEGDLLATRRRPPGFAGEAVAV